MGGRGANSSSSLGKISDSELQSRLDNKTRENREIYSRGEATLRNNGYIEYRVINGNNQMFITEKGKKSKEAQNTIRKIEKSQSELEKLQNERRRRNLIKRRMAEKNWRPF